VSRRFPLTSYLAEITAHWGEKEEERKGEDELDEDWVRGGPAGGRPRGAQAPPASSLAR